VRIVAYKFRRLEKDNDFSLVNLLSCKMPSLFIDEMYSTIVLRQEETS
jgi:hypothetical protein